MSPDQPFPPSADPHQTPLDSLNDTLDLPGAEWGRLETSLLALIAGAYGRGWQPSELLRQARREATRSAAPLAYLAIAADHRSRPDSAYHRLWLDQVEGLDLPIGQATRGWLSRALIPALAFGENNPAHRHAASDTALADDAWSLFVAWSPPVELPCLMPPPAGINARLVVDVPGAVGAHPMLDKVRALLAKAEATTFEAEAEVFTAKAHELMARHLIDDAILAASRRRTGRSTAAPITIRLPVDAPYATPKATLIAVVADAGGCRAVHHQSLGLTSVVGHAADVAAVELLFTSLLVQAQSSMHEQARLGQAHRSRGFRSSFLTAFAYRVGERLRDVNDQVCRSVENETGLSVVPVLAEREAAVQETFDEIFRNVVTRRARRQWDHRGLASGRTAADRAQLDTTAVPAAATDRALPGTR